MAHNITLKDVADKAGVSSATISMVIHNDTAIPEKTKLRIWRIIKSLGYVPNYAARSLAGGKTGNIALVSSYFHHHFYQEILRGIDMANKGKGYSLLQFTSQENRGVEEDIFSKILYGKMADGLITLNRNPGTKLLKECKNRDFPVLMIEQSHTLANSICCDNHRGAYLATTHLLGSGRKKIVLISGGEFWGPVVKERIAGYKKALMDHGLEYKEDHVFRMKQADFSRGKEALADLLKAGIKFDALFCAAGDPVAIGIMKEAENRGIKIPGDFSLIGYDDIEVSSYVTPALTTIKQPAVEMGKSALEIVSTIVHEPHHGDYKNTLFKPELVIRESG
ncbi:MAG: LacI family DNA-binding transcriptional regulator [Spirochaetales bacterium]|nr:LacI family DNA-binding transcriptional regulator [Spirochaetales bacterium]